MCSRAPASPSERRGHLRHVASRAGGPWGHARPTPASAPPQPPGPAHTSLQAPPSLDCYWLPTRTSCSVARLKEVGEEIVVRSLGSLVPPPISHSAARGLSRRVRQSRDMAEGGGWQPPRPCEAYRAEWELCSSAGHFLRHYYVHGERPACGQWRRDLDSCREWEERRSAEAQVTRPGVQSPGRPGTSPGARDAGRRGRAFKKGFNSSLHVCWGACFGLYP
ncbi:synaptic plasticity regulator PANTS isoform X1 [Physeter macrocephalus]|uniref:Synaptic plasticity regulator PANTS n=1 Tax=Physeter macrocephalus TaxID=9755 RepID=A0A2Y9FBT4_PHYMC|nr:UPF0545 protein C22orf39 homolog isoform X1 [Physeter catodon]|eukprot:XP_007119134.1 UPF0545 protein C22orf39 homolog isoform X1 [Physeter catodon]